MRQIVFTLFLAGNIALTIAAMVVRLPAQLSHKNVIKHA